MYSQFAWTKVADGRNAILKMYEPLQPFMLVELARRLHACEFIDVGANIGAYTLFISCVETIKQVVAIEAAPSTFYELKKNVELNGLGSRVDLINKAVSDHDGLVSFGMISEFSGANGVVSTSIHDQKSFSSQIDVVCSTLDDLLQRTGSRLVMKVDVEGHEESVLRGAKKTLRENVVLLQIENYSSTSDSGLKELIDVLGYRKIVTLGPDVYLTNDENLWSSEATVEAMEAAAAAMIKESLAVPKAGASRPLHIQVPGLHLQANGKLVDGFRAITGGGR